MACRDGVHGYEEGMKMRGEMLWRNPASLMLHVSFLVVLAGAICTWLLQQRGVVRLSPGEKVVEFRSAKGELLPLPAVMELDSFRVEYYHGGIAPRDYISYLKLGGRPCQVSMNNALETEGYIFCQSGYDYDGSSILSVNHDPWGITLVYTGFLMFAVSGLWVLLSRRCKWRSLLRRLSLLPLLAIPGTMSAANTAMAELNEKAGWEQIYSSVPFTTLIFILLFSGAALSFLALSGSGMPRKLSGFILVSATALSASCFILHWALSGHIPLSDTYETLLFAVLALELLILLACRKDIILRGIAMTFAGALALVAHLIEESPFEAPLAPVLNSPWLSIHVSLVMTAYALFGLTFVAAATAIISPNTEKRMHVISLAALYLAEWLLGLGIITGAVWANTSWGRYWSWDPKETLALLTFIIYALPLHGKPPRHSHNSHHNSTSHHFHRSLHNSHPLHIRYSFFRTTRRYHIYMLLAILSVAATYFGINYLPSLHSYS